MIISLFRVGCLPRLLLYGWVFGYGWLIVLLLWFSCYGLLGCYFGVVLCWFGIDYVYFGFVCCFGVCG